MAEGHVIHLFQACVGDQNKGNASLLFKFPHKGNLVRVKVLEGKGGCRALLGVKADGNALHRAYVSTVLFWSK